MPPTRERSASAPPRLETQAFLDQHARQFNQDVLVDQQAELAAQNARDADLRAQLRAQANARSALHASYKRYLQKGHAATAAATTLQAAVRGMQARKQFLAQQEAATTLQAVVRGAIARKELEEKKTAATTLQSLVRGHIARQEFRVEKAALTLQSAIRGSQAQETLQKLKDKRDADLAALRDLFDRGRTYMQTSSRFPFDQYLPTLVAPTYDGAVQELDEYVQKNDLGGYGKKLLAMRKAYQASLRDFKARIEMDEYYQSLLQDSALLAKAGVTTMPQLYANLAVAPSIQDFWTTLVDLCSAVTQDTNEIQDTIRQIIAAYRPPRVYARRATVPVFSPTNPNSWDVNPVRWHSDILKFKGTIEGSPGANKLDDIRLATLTGRTKGRSSVMSADLVMHEHLLGSEGVGFCYRREKDNSVTPWVLDYSSSRGGKSANDYKWERGGKGAGDPFINLPAQDDDIT